jgi:hypothetical protein
MGGAPGGVSEWSKEPVVKTGDGASHPGVRIPPSPQSVEVFASVTI